MAVGKWAPLVALLFVNAMAVGEMDSEQEIINNLKPSLAYHYMEQIAALQEQIGYMTRSYYQHTRIPVSGSNYICLSVQPTWDYYSESVNSDIGITGVQYEFRSHSQVLQDFFESDVNNKGAPCAVCRTPRSSSVMNPGLKDCYPGWSIEYSGFLVGPLPDCHDVSEFVCLDRRPEVVESTGNRYGDIRPHFVEAICGNDLKCPPYFQDRELACIVCSI